MNKLGHYDVIVIGGGHAGIEAALAAARISVSTALFTISLDAIGNMPCNPSIGGTAKGHLVREIDALGGEMAAAADATFIQSRMLNRGKGPAVHSLRVQSDRGAYHTEMKKRCEAQQNLDIKQAEIVEITTENDAVTGVVTNLGGYYSCSGIIIATGTFLKGTIFIGDTNFSSGPDGIHAANKLSASLVEHGVKLRRFKTGTPGRVHKRSINFDLLEEQLGDEKIVPMSFSTKGELKNQVSCYIAYTNDKTHEIIRDNLHRSPLYGGIIEGVGPRYCPSIEDKVVRFSDKKRHQLFIEPCGLDTDEYYLQGMSTSLPQDVQLKMYRSIKGLENVEIMRPAYAIEYDCVDPQQLTHTLEFKHISGLYGAGQFNGTSGYEEAAAQGLVAGANCALKILGREPLELTRSNSYIGTLIDDLVIKGVTDPYRMMTSRSEYRLLLRQDNAQQRLTEIGYRAGLVGDQVYNAFLENDKLKNDEMKRILGVGIAPSDKLNELLISLGTTPLKTGTKLGELLKRPGVTYDSLAPFDSGREPLEDLIREQVEVEIKYEGYIRRQLLQVDEFLRTEKRLLPKDIDYSEVGGLRLEAREKLNAVRPESLGQAARISGVSPADVSVLVIYLESIKKQESI